MTRFVLHRLVSSIPVLFGIVLAVFILARVIPGDPCIAALGERATEAVCDAYNQREGLDQPIWVQFGKYLGNLLQGDLGESVSQSRSVAEILVERLPTTIELSFVALTFAIIVGIPLGVIAAYKRNSAADVGTMVVANAGVSMPIFVLGLVLQYLFAVTLKDTFFALPPSGRLSPGLVATPFYEQWGWSGNGVLEFISNFEVLNGLLQWNWGLVVDATQHLILPAIAVGTIPLAIIARMTRSSLLDVLGQDYVRTARAKGFGELKVVRSHALRSALLPVVTVVGLSLGALFGGAILTETIFSLTGVGKTLGRCDHGARLRRRAGLCPDRRDLLRVRQPAHRPVVHRLRSTGSGLMTLVAFPGHAGRLAFPGHVGRPCVPRPRRPLENAPSLALGRSQRARGARSLASSGFTMTSDLDIIAGTAELAAPAPGSDHPHVPVPSPSRWRDVFRQILHSWSGRIGLVVATLIIAMAVFAPLIAPFGPDEVLLDSATNEVRLERPCVHVLGCDETEVQHLMGLDENGRDEFSRLVYGARDLAARRGRRGRPRCGRRHDHRSRRRVLRRATRQRVDALHGRSALVPVAVAGDPHRHRAGPRADQQRPGDRHRQRAGLRQGGPRPGAVGPRAGLHHRRPRPRRAQWTPVCRTACSPTR